MRLLKAHQDKDDFIGKLKEEIDLLNRVSSDLLIRDLIPNPRTRVWV